jgi:hypothetical protein
MKQAILKTKKPARQSVRENPADFFAQVAQSPVHEDETVLIEQSPWVVEIQNALSPYWSARLAR